MFLNTCLRNHLRKIPGTGTLVAAILVYVLLRVTTHTQQMAVAAQWTYICAGVDEMPESANGVECQIEACAYNIEVMIVVHRQR